MLSTPPRHPELVSGSMPRSLIWPVGFQFSTAIEAWMLKQVQHDEVVLEAAE